MEIIIQNVRSIVKRQTIPLAPLTLLIGENSSGKSTFLAVLSALSDTQGYPFFPKFNDAPYNLGSFDTIATYKGGEYGRAKTFSIGHTRRRESGDIVSVLAQYRSNRGQIELSRFTFKSSRTALEISLNENNPKQYKARLTVPSEDRSELAFQFELEKKGIEESQSFDFRLALFDGLLSVESSKMIDVSVVRSLNEVSASISTTRSLSIAPIRTKPSRTYDQISEQYSPEGLHIPFVLARLLGRGASSEERNHLLKGLKRFGKESGLFTHVGIKQLGSQVGDPFQIMVAPSGRAANLLDVGYGVSQALPIIVQSILTNKPLRLLLQQPEVHLHPRAQAALGTFFVRQVNAERQFIVETHSDFIVDRIRQEVAAGNIPKEMVSLLFFRKQKFDTTISRLNLDDTGNIIDAPSGYREFFLREELNLLTNTGETI